MRKRFRDLHEYISSEGIKKYAVADRLGVSRYQMSALLYPQRYSPAISEELAVLIAALLNQTPSYVRTLYAKAKAA